MENVVERGFEPVKVEARKTEGRLPLRGTKTSAGYDFYATEDLVIKPEEKVFFWTDIKAKMREGEVLLGFIRSSKGVKQDLMLANTVAVIDSDYYGNENNDGNIGLSIRNLKPKFRLDGMERLRVGYREFEIPLITDLTKENTVVIKAGERVAQFIFVKFEESENCNSEEVRTGGFGSTLK